jgi:hypothetical protein
VRNVMRLSGRAGRKFGDGRRRHTEQAMGETGSKKEHTGVKGEERLISRNVHRATD